MMKMKTKTKLLIGGNIAGILLTPAERAAGRLLRAPDHDASTGGDGGNGNADGSTDGARDGAGAVGEGSSGAAAPGGAGAGEAASAASGGGEGQADGGGASGGGDGGDGSRTFLGEAGDADGGDGSDDGSGNAPRATFGEGEAAVAILGAPEAYELTVPAELAEAGVQFDQEAFAAIEPELRELNLSNDAAQKIVGAYAAKILPLIEQRASAQADQLGADMRRTWAEDAAKQFDGKEGRASLGEVKALCKQAFLGAGIKADSGFLKLMEDSGLGSHPDMIRTIAFFGRMLGEAKVDQGDGGEAPVRLADKIYGRPEPRE